MTNLLSAMFMAAIIVFVIHCNIWYWGLTPSQRRALDEDDWNW